MPRHTHEPTPRAHASCLCQAIFGWRHARGVETIQALPTSAVRQLTRTWRYGYPLAARVSQLIRSFKGGVHGQFEITGHPERATRLVAATSAAAPYVACLHDGVPLAVLGRLNRTLFAAAIAALANGIERLYFAGERQHCGASTSSLPALPCLPST